MIYSITNVMRYLPLLPEFCKMASAYPMVPVYRQLTSDTLTPVSAFRAIESGDYDFLFESVVGGERVGRFSFLGSRPIMTFRAFDRRIEVRYTDGRAEDFTATDPLKELEIRLAPYRAPHLPGLSRFTGGAVGYASYDTVRYSEDIGKAPPDDRQLPDLCFGVYDQIVMFDHINKTICVLAMAHLTPGADPAIAYETACRAIDGVVEKLRHGGNPIEMADIDPSAGKATIEYRSNFTQQQYEQAVEKCREYITAGDIFQVVLSQRLETTTTATPLDIYRALRVINPSPFMFFLRCGGPTLLGASPEIMTRVYDGQVVVRPLAGTRRRGATPEEDRALEAELLADPKERAEHIMLVDLGRNDIGRIATFGSVQLDDLMIVEKYSHVMHISSTVSGDLQPGKSSFDALRSCLPAGTLSGAPKIRAMQIIDELEPHRRGPYGGAVGYIDFKGDMDTCIALRTMVIIDNTAYIQAGAGLVADSNPTSEYQETMSKAMGLLRAVEIAQGQLTRTAQ